jgi:hypothetical protein
MSLFESQAKSFTLCSRLKPHMRLTGLPSYQIVCYQMNAMRE